MFKKFSLLLALLFALSAGMVQAQTFTYVSGTDWNNAATWMVGGGASNYPGLTANNGDVSIGATVTFTSIPGGNLSSLTIQGGNVTLAAGTLTITGNLSIQSGTLTIPNGLTVIVNGSTSINGSIALGGATARLQMNGPVSGGGSMTCAAAAAAPQYNVQLGSGVTSISGALFAPSATGFNGVINTQTALTLTSSLTIASTGFLNLVGIMTISPNTRVTILNSDSNAINRDATAGQLQGATSTSIVDFSTSGPTAINGTWFATPFNGRLQTSGAGASTFSATMTFGSSGVLDLRAGLTLTASSNLILNNTTMDNSVLAPGQITIPAMSTVTIGPGFNGGTINFDRFVSPIQGTFQTGGAVTATGTADPIVNIGNGTDGSLNLTGTLTIANGKRILISGTATNAITGFGTLAAATATSTVEFAAATANGGIVPGANFANPWNGTIITPAAAGMTMGGGNMTVGPTGILRLGNNLTIQSARTLTMNCTSAEGTALPLTGLIVGGAADAVLEIGAGAFNNYVPVNKIGTGTGWAAGILRILGSPNLDNQVAGAYTFILGTAAFLELSPTTQLQVLTGKTLDLRGTLQRVTSPMQTGMGKITAQDNTAIVNLNPTTFQNGTGTGTATQIPGVVFGAPTFGGRLQIGQDRTLVGNLRIGLNGALDITGFVLTVSGATDTLFLNPTAAAGLASNGTSRISGTGTVFLGDNALVQYPTSVLQAFSGRVIMGAGITFGANTILPNNMLLQLNGAVTISPNITVTVTNTANNAVSGTGTIQGNSGSILSFNPATANGGNVPGANIFGTPDDFSRAFIGTIQTAGAMNLTGNLNIGQTSVLNLGGDLRLSPTSRVLLQQTGNDSTAFAGSTGKLRGQPGSAGTPEIILSTNAFVSRMLPSSRLTLGSNDAASGDFGGRLTLGSNFSITTMEGYNTTLTNTVVGGNPFTVNSPASLNILPGATLTVGAGAGLRLATTNSTPLGTTLTTGTIQAANNTAIVEFTNPFSPTIRGDAFVTPFNGALVINNALNLEKSIHMSATSLLVLNNVLTVRPNSSLRLEGGVNTVQGTGSLSGTNSLARIILANNFNGGTLPTGRFGNPVNATLITEGPMTLDGSFNISPIGALNIGGNLTLPASAILTMSQTALGSFGTTNGARVAGASSSRVVLGGNFNSRLLQGDAFTDFAGQIAINSPMSLISPLRLNVATSQLDLGGATNSLTLHGHGLTVVNPILNTTATAFIVTNGVGDLTVSNATLSSVFFPIGVTSASYSPISIRSTSGTADIFTVRVQEANTLTNPSSDFIGYVNREWIVSGAAPTVSRGMSITPQWAAANERGTFLRYSAGVAAFATATGIYLRSSTSATSTLPTGDFTVSGNMPVLAYSNTTVVVYSIRPTYLPVILNPLAISAVVPSSVPANNDPVTVRLSGFNLTLPGNQVVARHGISGVRVEPTTTATQGPELILTFPGSIRTIPGPVTISITNANTSFASVTFNVTSVAAPTITALAPSTTATGRAFTMTVTGTGFFSNAQVTVNNAAVRPVAATSATTAFIEIPASLNATSNTFTVRVRNSDGQVAERTFTVGQANRPVITAVTPRVVFQNSSDTEITLSGTGFFGTGNVAVFFGSQLIPSRFVSSTQLVITVPANLLTTVGNPSIIVSNSDAQNVGYVFSVLERVPLGPTPRITSVTPSVTTASFRSFSVNIQGENFNPSAVVTVLGQLVTVTRTGTTGLAVQIPAGLNTTTNTYEIVIQNPDLQFTTANVRIGDRLNAPTIAGLLPSATVASLQVRPFAITIRGTNFTQDAQVLWNGLPLQIVSVSATSILVNVPENGRGLYTLVVLNGDGQATAPLEYNITSSVTVQTLPNISIYPSPVYDNMTISGGFAAPTTVQVTVTNIVGQRVMSFTEQVSGVYSRNVNMSELPTGAYLVEVRDGARRLVQKVVKY